jgi:hypothetical protein
MRGKSKHINVGDLVSRYFAFPSTDAMSVGIVVEKLSTYVVTVYWYKVDEFYHQVGRSDEAVLNLEILSRAPKKTIDIKK